MKESVFLGILNDIHNYGFFSGLRKDGEIFQLWKDENPLISFLLSSNEEVEYILENIFITAYNDGLKNVCDTNITSWIDDNPTYYSKIRSVFVSS